MNLSAISWLESRSSALESSPFSTAAVVEITGRERLVLEFSDHWMEGH
jgi:hypothetical protein